TTNNLSDRLGLIRSALLQGVGTKITGSKLRAVIDYTCPGFDVRAAAGAPGSPGTLSAFLKLHFADIVHLIGKRGGDNLYFIGPTNPPVAPLPTNPPVAPASLWAAFGSPSLRQDVVFDRVHRSVSAPPREHPISPDQVQIAPISSVDFR